MVSKRVVLADVAQYQKPERGYIQMFPGTKKTARGCVRMFPGTKNRNEGTFVKTTLSRNHPFVSSRFFLTDHSVFAPSVECAEKTAIAEKREENPEILTN